jgi:dTDP-4-amino-4,6-dideoxygalactose transaminase
MISLGLRRINKTLLPDLEALIESEQWCRYYDIDGHYQSGKVMQFEAWARNFLNKHFVLATTSGTQSLTLALHALNVRGKEVIIPAYSFVACAIAVLCAGATPVIAPVTERLALDIEALKALLTDQTAAIMPVHMRGIVNEVAIIQQIARAHGCAVLEDCSQFDGLSIAGQSHAGVSDICVFSLQARKFLSGGEGGLVATDSEDLYRKMFMMHDPVWFVRQSLPFPALADEVMLTPGSRMNEVTATVLLHQATGLNAFLTATRARQQQLYSLLSGRVPLLPPAPLGCQDGASLVLRAGDSEQARIWRRKLSAAQLHIYPESANEQDSHFYIGWPAHILSHCLCPVPLEESRGWLARSVLLQVDPAWTAEEVAQVAEQIIQCLTT